MILKRKLKPRFVLCIIFIVVVIFFVSNEGEMAYSYRRVNVRQGEVVLSEKGRALIIRDEIVHSISDAQLTDFLVSEGDFVSAGDNIAIISNNEQNRIVNSETDYLNDSIHRRQMQLLSSSAKYYQLDILDKQIKDEIVKLQQNVLENTFDAAEKVKDRLSELLILQQELIDRIVEPDDKLKSLYRLEAEINNRMLSSAIFLESPEDGLVSFYTDDLESTLGLAALDAIDAGFVFSDFFQTQEISENIVGGSTNSFRLINPNRWFMIAEMELNSTLPTVGEKIEVELIERNQTISGNVLSTHKNDHQTLIVLEFSTDADKIINIRRSNVVLRRVVTGLMVPMDSLVENEDGTAQIRIIDNESTILARILIRAKADKYAIIEDVADGFAVSVDSFVAVSE